MSSNTTGFVSDEPGGSLHGISGALSNDWKQEDPRRKKNLWTRKRVFSTWEWKRQSGESGMQVWLHTLKVTSPSAKKYSLCRCASEILGRTMIPSIRLCPIISRFGMSISGWMVSSILLHPDIRVAGAALAMTRKQLLTSSTAVVTAGFNCKDWMWSVNHG